MDNRRHPRKALPLEIAFQMGDGPRIQARCQNLSLGGMFIETREAVAYGAALKIFVRLPGLAHETAIPSVVRWNKPDGMGVQFGSMRARDTHALIELLTGMRGP